MMLAPSSDKACPTPFGSLNGAESEHKERPKGAVFSVLISYVSFGCIMN